MRLDAEPARRVEQILSPHDIRAQDALEGVLDAHGAEMHDRADVHHQALDVSGIRGIAQRDRLGGKGWTERANVRAPQAAGPLRQVLAQPVSQCSGRASEEYRSRP